MEPRIEDLRRDLAAFSGREVLIFGSWCAGERTPRSDIDVALLTRSRDRAANEALWWGNLGKAPDRYDLRVFELLPIHVQADIARRHVVLFGDPAEIGEYLHQYRRRWLDVRHRYEEPLPIPERWARLRGGVP